jgi:hypothetical protein
MQHYKNHSRYSVLFHLVTLPLLLAVIIGSFFNLYYTTHENLYSASLISLLSILVMIIAFKARGFALKAQDRAIRAEENFRYFMLTNKLPDSRLTMSQMIALRFASNDEFEALAERAANEKLSSAEIKKSIKNWRADFHRV